MDSEYALDQQIRSEIEELRTQFPQTQDLYREVCTLLFFRYGQTPTANRLYQLVRKGSMSAPAEALARFWAELREKSRVRIENPDLPDDLKQVTGELIANLWTKAQAMAQESLAIFREEAAATILEAQTQKTASEHRLGEVLEELQSAQESLTRAAQRIRSLEQIEAAAEATRTQLEEQLRHERAEQARLQRTLDDTRSSLESTRRDLDTARQGLAATSQQLDDTRRELTEELQRLRASLQAAEVQHQSERQSTLAELEQARTQLIQLERDLKTARSMAELAADQHRAEAAALRSQQGDLRQQLGIVEGNLQATLALRDQLATELNTARSHQATLTEQLGAARVEAELWKTQTQNLEAKLLERASGTDSQSVPAQKGEQSEPQALKSNIPGA
jgi:chromosome segregation ATPase